MRKVWIEDDYELGYMPTKEALMIDIGTGQRKCDLYPNNYCQVPLWVGWLLTVIYSLYIFSQDLCRERKIDRKDVGVSNVLA